MSGSYLKRHERDCGKKQERKKRELQSMQQRLQAGQGVDQEERKGPPRPACGPHDALAMPYQRQRTGQCLDIIGAGPFAMQQQ